LSNVSLKKSEFIIFLLSDTKLQTSKQRKTLLPIHSPIPL